MFVALAGLQPSFPRVAAGLFGMLFCVPFVGGYSSVLLQEKVPLELKGRVFAVAEFIQQIAMPLSLVIVGPLADRVFEPLLAPGGPLVGTVGQLLGVGPGRGVALLMVLTGIVYSAVSALAMLNPGLRRLEGA